MSDPLAVAPVTSTAAASAPRGVGLLRALVAIGNALLAIVVIFVAWQLIVKGAHLDKFTTRGPLDVWKYLRDKTFADEHKEIYEATRITVRDAALGLVCGTVAGVGVALLFNRWRFLERALMPIAISFRAIPIVAMTPVIVLIFHRGLVTVAVMVGIVTFFPTLVNVGLALRAVPTSSIDLMQAYGASKGRTLWKVQLPSSLPALMASIRIAAPLALVGAFLAEWLATNEGLGSVMITAAPASLYNKLWASAAIATLLGVLLYGVVSGIEQIVLQRFSADPDRR